MSFAMFSKSKIDVMIISNYDKLYTPLHLVKMEGKNS